MDKQKQIEEMAKSFCPYEYNKMAYQNCEQCRKALMTGCEYFNKATTLYNAGYRKIDENAVVLTEQELFARDRKLRKADEEYIKALEEYIKALEECINNRNPKLRKETAEKFAEMSKKRFEKAKNAYKGASQVVINHGKMMFHKGEERAMEKAIQFIDEICKEITEDKNGETIHRD